MVAQGSEIICKSAKGIHPQLTPGAFIRSQSHRYWVYRNDGITYLGHGLSGGSWGVYP